MELATTQEANMNSRLQQLYQVGHLAVLGARIKVLSVVDMDIYSMRLIKQNGRTRQKRLLIL